MEMRVEIIEQLEEHGLLLKTDPKLPNVCAMVVGATVCGSWWAHPRSHEIFRVLTELAAHPDALVAKLVSGKDTFVHRALWPAVFSIGVAREPWQMDRLDKESRALLASVEEQGEVRTSGKSALELERLLLVHGQDVHTHAGSHATVLTSWNEWARRNKVAALPAADAKRSLEKLVDRLNRRFQGSGRLPWRGWELVKG
jgi:hypothetical protein